MAAHNLNRPAAIGMIFQYFIAKYRRPKTPDAAGHNSWQFFFSLFSST
jgi:hypothetical protein